MSIPLTFGSFTPSLLKAVPELKPLYQEHINDYDRLLEHVFLGDVTRFVILCYKNKENLDCLDRILNMLDQAIKSEDKKLQELVSVSFLENLQKNDDCFDDIKKLLSESLRKELAQCENKKKYFSVKPTICLISENQHFDKEKIAIFIKKMIKKGCVFFLFWGSSANELHDLADEIIERENMLNIVTTSHKNENAKDIAYFLLKATFFETCPHRFLVFLDETEKRNKLLINELLELTKTWE